MRLAGQSCISVQNVYVHASLYDEFVERLVAGVKRLPGRPLDPKTDVGTLIDEAAARRVSSGSTKRSRAGTRAHGRQAPRRRVRADGARRSLAVDARGLRRDLRPVVTVQRFSELQGVLDRISAEQYGLQCGLFTQSIPVASNAIRSLRVGGLIVNGTSTWRTDQLAYGGIKASGSVGRAALCRARHDRRALVVFNV